MGVSGNLWIVVKDVKTLVVYDVAEGILKMRMTFSIDKIIFLLILLLLFCM